MAETNNMPETNPLFGKAAVLEGLPDHPAVKAILVWNADALTDAKFDFNELTLTIAPEFAQQPQRCKQPATTSLRT